MMSRPDLARELGGPLPALELLTDAEATELLALFRAARERETAALLRSIEVTLDGLPRPLRALTRRVMFGDLAADA
ncbi:hypothetical protein [Nocardia thailandica]|uniref:hypothetical protein n=1 Tax=Nocardia thailandica TaxID=257275 RepID=UPI0002F3200A|nr:hypothetical protein [Nocardia thailandica]